MDLERPDHSEDEIVALARGLVRIPSVFGGEKDAAEFAARAMADCGFDTVEVDSIGNAVGVIEGGKAGPTLLFDAHVDTIDVIPREAWTRDPFGGELDGGKIYGRGTSDMKGSLAAMIHAAARVDRGRICGRVVVSGSVAEEIIEGAALKEVMNRYSPDCVVIGESTALSVVRGGRGRAEVLVTTKGKPAHASTPHLGINAIHKMLRVIEAIEEIPPLTHPIVGEGVMALTDLISDPYPAQSVVPSRCRATFERRLIPGETPQSVRELFLGAFESAHAEDSDLEAAVVDHGSPTGFRFRQEKWFPAWEIAEEDPFLKKALAGTRAVGLDPVLSAYQFCTNAAYSSGVAGVPTIGFGPSTEALAHTVDEFVEVEQLVLAARGYAGIIGSVLRN